VSPFIHFDDLKPEQMELAADEAPAQLAIDQPEPEIMDWHGEEPPF
jgi:hypothetical protein